MTPGNLRARMAAAGTAVTGTGAAASLALALLVLVCAFVAVAVPRASLGYRTAVLQRSFHAESSSATTVLADATINGLSGGSLSAAQLASAQRQLSDGLGRDGLPLAPATADWSGMVTGSAPFTVTGRAPDRTLAPPQLELLYRSALGRNARLVSGALPGAGASVSIGTGTGAGTGIRGTLQVAVTQVTAARFGLHPGSRLQAAGHAILVTGIIRPLRPASSFWTVDPVAAAPQLTYPTPDSPPYLSSGAFVSAAELTALQDYLSAPLRALWSFPLGLAGVTADQAAGLGRALAAVGYLPAATSVGTSLNASAGPAATIQVTLSSGLATSLPSFVATDDAVQRALSLMFVSLAVIAAVVVLLGARLVVARRRSEFTMMRARGASLRQIGAVALAGRAASASPSSARPSSAGTVPALISPAGRVILGPHSDLYVAGRQLRIRVAGTISAIAGGAAGTQFAVLPRWALGAQAPAPIVLVMTGSQLDQAALVRVAKRAVPGAQVTLRSRVQAAIAAAPLPHGGFVTFAQGAAAAAGFSLLVVLLTLVLGARSRELTLARLATMGLAADQSRRIVAVETLPAILAAAVGGTACALLLVPLAGPAVNLAAFTGRPVTVPLRADPAAIVIAAVALLLLGALTLTISSRLARSRGAAQALRVGETAGG